MNTNPKRKKCCKRCHCTERCALKGSDNCCHNGDCKCHAPTKQSEGRNTFSHTIKGDGIVVVPENATYEEKCKDCGHLIVLGCCRCVGKGGDFEPSTPKESWEGELVSLFDSFFEPNVSETDKHPNCKYTLTCGEVSELLKELKSFIRLKEQRDRKEWAERVRGMKKELVMENMPPMSYAYNQALEDIARLLESGSDK